ncbi:MAG: L-seryl-tRNA(Sec) selenium transferase [Acidobacteria bacterium]|nr:L-seryl-tRNA(Sec) selenium transferase [Acidobacteriota bacterium]
MPGEPDLSRLPPVDALLREAAVEAWLAGWRRPLVVRFLREALDDVRAAIREGRLPGAGREALARRALDLAGGRLRRFEEAGPRRVINATGVMIHTNLGRSPLGEPWLKLLGRTLHGYTDLEYDLATGGRGRRDTRLAGLIRDLLGAEDGTAVNNNAGALLLALQALAAGGEVIVSRGELVEIGGSFRVPDIMALSGARLREVGTTNRTRLADYAAAVTPETRLLLQVHRSNFEMTGFVETPSVEALVALSRDRGVPLLVDAGSGLLFPPDAPGRGAPSGGPSFPRLPGEPVVTEILQAGADLVCFSGDKLLGGPQAGILAGRADLVGRIRSHPLMRALRLDKLVLTALAACLKAWARTGTDRAVPLLDMAAEPLDALEKRCRRFVRALKRSGGAAAGKAAGVSPVEAVLGGGSTPGKALPSRAVVLRLGERESAVLEARLRRCKTPVVARVDRGGVVLDFRTVRPGEEKLLLASLLESLQGDEPEKNTLTTSLRVSDNGCNRRYGPGKKTT